MAIFETWLQTDLKKPIQVVQLPGNLFSADNGGNLIGVEVFDNGSAASLSGAVTGYLIRSDNATVTVTGTLSGNKASIVLPASAYTAVGQLSVVIKVGATSVGACVAHVYRTTTDTIVDPGQVIPSLADLLAQIGACEAATTAATNAASSANTAASSANTAASNANTKASAADTAAGSANTAASSANSAATAANTAAGKIDNMTVAAQSGSSAAATISEVSGHKHIQFTLPKGDTGATGAVPDIEVGTVTTLQPDQQATVTRRAGSPDTAPIFDFALPKGETGSVGNIYATTIPMSSQDSTKISEAIASKKNTQSAVSDPSASGTSATFIASISQDAQGVITPSKSTVRTMTGASSSAGGATGLVPAPSAGDENKFLKADGTWNVPPGTKPVVVSLDTVTNTSGSYTHTTTIANVTASMKPIQIEVGNPDAFRDAITVSCTDGYVTLSCSDVVGTSTITVTLMEQGSIPASGQTVTSSEFDILNARIGALNTLTTTEKGSAVGAINEVKTKSPNTNSTGTITQSNLPCFGFITTNATDLDIFIPMLIESKATNVSVSSLTIGIRHVGGGYIGGANNTDITSYISNVLPYKSFAGLRIIASKSGGWGATNNTPVCGVVNITLTLT